MVLPTIVAAPAGGYLLERLHVPAGALIGAMAAVAALNLTDLDTAELPEWSPPTCCASSPWSARHR